MKLYGVQQVRKMTGLTWRKLHWWDTTGLIVPSFRKEVRGRKLRRYSERDVALLRLVLDLQNAGHSTHKCRKILDMLQEILRSNPRMNLRTTTLVVLGKRNPCLVATDGCYGISVPETRVAKMTAQVYDIGSLWPEV